MLVIREKISEKHSEMLRKLYIYKGRYNKQYIHDENMGGITAVRKKMTSRSS